MRITGKQISSRITRFEQPLGKFFGNLKLAVDYAEKDPAGSMNKSRIVLEGLVLDIYAEKMKREPKKPQLGMMLNDNQFTRLIEPTIVVRMQGVNGLGNTGSHRVKGPLTTEDAILALMQLCDILEWRFGGLKRDIDPGPVQQNGKVRKSYGTCYAVLVGIDQYPKLPNERALRYAVKDAMTMKETLGKFGFSDSNIWTLTNEQATKARLEETILSEVCQKVKEEDCLLFFFAGHGGLRKPVKKDSHRDEKGYLLPYDAEEESRRLAATAIPMSRLGSGQTI